MLFEGDIMFYLKTMIKAHCCGCRACEQICSRKCISMVEDDEGFYYPLKNNAQCTNCGLCENVCPNVNYTKLINTKIISSAYMAIHHDTSVLANSSSGGAFTAIVNTYCREGDFVVFGAEINDCFEVFHSYSKTLQETEKYRKSKYVQSNIGDCYQIAEKFLKENKKVLFTGTPCQIAGLRLYLRNDYTNLFCVDLICHGVPNQKIFNLYVKSLEKKHGGKLKTFSFRHKTFSRFGTWNSRNVRYTINNKVIVKDSWVDPYLKGYHSGLFCRLSCYECKFANSNRVSDITVGDFWGVENLYPNEKVHRGVSVLLANTEKGQQLVREMGNEMCLTEVDLEYVIKNNGQLRYPLKPQSLRNLFFQNLAAGNFDDAVEQCIPWFPYYIRRLASRVLPERSKVFIKRILRS